MTSIQSASSNASRSGWPRNGVSLLYVPKIKNQFTNIINSIILTSNNDSRRERPLNNIGLPKSKHWFRKSFMVILIFVANCKLHVKRLKTNNNTPYNCIPTRMTFYIHNNIFVSKSVAIFGSNIAKRYIRWIQKQGPTIHSAGVWTAHSHKASMHNLLGILLDGY